MMILLKLYVGLILSHFVNGKLYINNAELSVSKTNKEFAGEVMANRSAAVILGIKRPLLLLATSNMALLFGAAPVALIPIF